MRKYCRLLADDKALLRNLNSAPTDEVSPEEIPLPLAWDGRVGVDENEKVHFRWPETQIKCFNKGKAPLQSTSKLAQFQRAFSFNGLVRGRYTPNLPSHTSGRGVLFKTLPLAAKARRRTAGVFLCGTQRIGSAE